MDEKLGEIISALDTASGMLIVTAIRNQTVREAMELVLKASFDLGNIIDELEEVNQTNSDGPLSPPEIAEMHMDGTLCEMCGEFIGDPVGYPRVCVCCEE